nr:uncharacterized protein LOC109153584 [Ipomoea batatas]
MTGTVVEFAEVMAKIGNTRTGVESSRRLKKLFEYAGYYLSRDTFQFMRAGELKSILVDIWCQRLNQLDLNRGVDKPKRIFFSTQAFLQLDSPSNWTNDDDPANSSNQIDFEQCLDTEISNVANLGISDAQLNTTFAKYLHRKGHTNLVEKIKNLPVELVKMNWRTADNKTDCGLYCMRHMETYMGNPQWKCSFTPKKTNDLYLTSLRALYTSQIIMMPVNKHKAKVIKKAQEYFVGKKL